jgi:hypothetical protein
VNMKKIGRKESSFERKLASWLEARNIEEFLDLRSRPWKLIWLNFVIGLSRGFGFLLGATVVGALLLAWIKHAVVKLGGMPWLGEKAAEIIQHIDTIKQASGQ